MIRIDEIYYNVFVKAIQHRPRVGLHWFDPFGSTNIADLCNVPAVDGTADLRLIFWDQEPVYQDTAKDFFDVFSKTYNGPTIIVTSEKSSQDVKWVCDTYGIDHDYYFFHGWAALDWYRGYNHSYLYQPWSERSFQHRFICPNNIIGGKRQHRLALLSALDQKNLISQNLVSFPATCPYENLPASTLLQDASLPPLKTQLPLMIDRVNNHANSSHRIDFWDQAQSAFCHVVTETVYQSSRIHLTEKVFKPIVLQQPFVLVSGQHSLSYLRSYGFQTFNSIWDEGYDECDDHNRIDRIVDILETVNSWSHNELLEAQHQARRIVEHNFQWFYGGFQDLLWKELTDMVGRWR